MSRTHARMSWCSGQSSVVVVICLVIFSVHTVSGILCYVCNDKPDNTHCNQEEHLINCTTQAARYDTCVTIVDHKGDTKNIRKRCGQGPCTLGKSQDKALSLDLQCTPGKGDWTCESCCTKDKCNFSHASELSPNMILPMTLCVLSLVSSIFARRLSL